ncbi:MAG: Holliday junction branch migration protein RuvA, partial [Burkholderiaceae bacterium]|nr:Holliday junction branch migration protein RuvA [Burkholderiaceae bacterium]
ERQAFRELIRIAGIGARTALAVLSGLSVEELAQAVALQESGRLTQIPGIGKKTAERLLLELKGRLAPALQGSGTPAAGADAAADIVRALVALGYSEKEAVAASRLVPPGTAVTDGIRLALKSLAKP